MLLGAVLGAAFGFPWAGMAVGVVSALFFQFHKLNQLYRWLRRGRTGPFPELGGLWDEVVREVHRRDRDSDRHEKHLSGQFDRLQAAASAMPDAMVVLSQGDVIDWANPPAERMLGLHAARDVGTRLVHLVRDPTFATYLEGGDYRDPLIFRPSVEPLTVAVQIIPFGASEKLVIARDISHVKKLEDMRRHFVADVSHELRTPLTVLHGFLESFQDVFADGDPDLRASLVLMREQVDRMRRLVEDLLALSRLETTPARTRDEIVVMQTMVAGLCNIAKALGPDGGHHIEVEVGDVALIGNTEELRGAFTNLVQNAVRHTPPGGRIRISWTTDSAGGRFAVADTGEGIPERHIPFLTERFYRVDGARSRASGGTGLGLSIVSQVLLRHDARLAIESVVGKGSTFTCIFPSSRLTPGAPGSLPPPPPV